MYRGHGRLCVCLSVCLSLASLPHYCTDPDITWRNGKGCSLVLHYWLDLQSVHVWLSVYIAALVQVQGLSSSFRIYTASLIHLVRLSDSLSKIVAAVQLITWLSWDAWSVSADLFCSDRRDARWFPVKGLLVMDSTSVLCSFNLVPNFLSVSPM